jgi:undecaprenyl-diphosphatase
MFSAFLEAAGRLDFAAFQWLRAHHSPLLDVVMAGLSDIARGGIIWIAFAVLIAFLYRPRWPAVVHVVLSVVLAFMMSDYVAKPFFNRSRPFETYADSRVYGYRPTTPSFPSGHAASAIAGIHALVRLAPEARAIFWLFALLVAFSRVYLGVHYPADVFAGSLLGFGIGKFVVGQTRWRFAQQERNRSEDRKKTALLS